MPVIRISDAAFADLKSIAVWLETETPSRTIESLVREKMRELDLERDIEAGDEFESASAHPLEFDKAPGLSFTRVLSAKVDRRDLGKTNWAGALLSVIERVKAKGFEGERLVRELQVPAKASVCNQEGYKFHAGLGISIQGQSATDAWKEISRLADKHGIPVRLEFQWRDNPKAERPGHIGVLHAGG